MKQCVDAKCSFEIQKPKPIKVQEDYLKRYTKNIAEQQREQDLSKNYPQLMPNETQLLPNSNYDSHFVKLIPFKRPIDTKDAWVHIANDPDEPNMDYLRYNNLG